MKEEAINGQVTERKGILNYAARLGFARLLASFLYNYREIRCQLPFSLVVRALYSKTWTSLTNSLRKHLQNRKELEETNAGYFFAAIFPRIKILTIEIALLEKISSVLLVIRKIERNFEGLAKNLL